MSTPASRRHRSSPQTASQAKCQRGYALIEALAALLVVLAGLLPMAVLGAAGMGWLRQLEGLGQSTRSAAEDAESGHHIAMPMLNPDSAITQVAGAHPGTRLPSIALWVRP